MASNRSLAEYNLQQQPKLESRKQALYEAHQNKAAIQEVFEKNRQKLGKVSLNFKLFIIKYNFGRHGVLFFSALDSDEEVWGQILAKVIVFCQKKPYTGQFTVTMHLSNLGYKWTLANCLGSLTEFECCGFIWGRSSTAELQYAFINEPLYNKVSSIMN